MEIDEFDAIAVAWSKMHENDYHDKWERMRLLATISIQPHVKKKIMPHILIPLPWDNKPQQKAAQPMLTPEQHKQRFEAMLKRCRPHQ